MATAANADHGLNRMLPEQTSQAVPGPAWAPAPGFAAQQVCDPPWTLQQRGEAAVQTLERSGQVCHQSRSYDLEEMCPTRVYNPKFNYRNTPQKWTGWH